MRRPGLLLAVLCFHCFFLALTLTKTLKGMHYANLMPCQVAAGSLPSVVLSQARSRREDLQQAHGKRCFLNSQLTKSAGVWQIWQGSLDPPASAAQRSPCGSHASRGVSWAGLELNFMCSEEIASKPSQRLYSAGLLLCCCWIDFGKGTSVTLWCRSVSCRTFSQPCLQL